jgi:hypothetical protein
VAWQIGFTGTLGKKGHSGYYFAKRQPQVITKASITSGKDPNANIQSYL